MTYLKEYFDGVTDALKERLNKIEDAYKADFETAKEIIFQGAQTHASILRCEANQKKHDERINKLEKFHSDWKAMPKWDLNPLINKINKIDLHTLDSCIYFKPNEEQHHPSRQHLEKCLNEKNERIKQLEQTLDNAKISIQGYNTGTRQLEDMLLHVQHKLMASKSEVENLKGNLRHGAKVYDDLKKRHELLRDSHERLGAEHIRLLGRQS